MTRPRSAMLACCAVAATLAADARADGPRSDSSKRELAVTFALARVRTGSSGAAEDARALENDLAPDDPALAPLRLADARDVFVRGDVDAARAPLIRAADLWAAWKPAGGDVIPEAPLILLNARLMRMLGDRARARTLVEQVLRFRSDLGCDPDTIADAHVRLAVLANEDGDATRAEAELDRAAAVARLRPNDLRSKLAATAVDQARQALHTGGDLRKMAETYESALASRGALSADDAITLVGLGELRLRLGDAAEAKRRFAQALELAPEGADGALAHAKLALVAAGQGDAAAADQHYRAALDALSAIPESVRTEAVRREAPGLDGVATCHWGAPSPSSVLALTSIVAASSMTPALNLSEMTLNVSYEKSPGDAISIELGTHQPDARPERRMRARTYAAAASSIATIALRRGDLDAAERRFRDALDVERVVFGPISAQAAADGNNVGSVYFARLDYDRARPSFEAAIAALDRPTGDKAQLGIALDNLAVIADDRHEASALATHARARTLLEAALGPRDPTLATALYDEATAQRQAGNLDAAEDLDRRALDIREEALGPASPPVAESLEHLGTLRALRGDVAGAVKLYDRAGDVSDRVLDLVVALGTDAEKAQYTASLWRDEDAALSLHALHFPDDAAARRLALTTVLRRKGRALDASLGESAALRAHLDENGRSRLAELATARAALARVVLYGGGLGPSARRAEADRLAEQVRADEAALSAASAAFRATHAPVAIDDVQRALQPDEALVEIAAFRPFVPDAPAGSPKWLAPRYVAYVLRATGEPSSVLLGDVERVDALVRALRASLDHAGGDPRGPARALDRAVFEPLAPLLGDATRVVLSPDGALALVPFGSLVGADGRYRIEGHSFDYVSSGRDRVLARARAGVAPGEPLVVAAPDFGQAAAPADGASDLARAYFAPLPGTAAEARAVSELLAGAKVFTGGAATKGALLGAHGPSVLHVATHGFFLDERSTASAGDRGFVLSAARAENPPAPQGPLDPLLRAGLALASANDHSGNAGVLTALEASGLDLWGTRLVVLSACETGVGDVRPGEGVYGLRRAFALAGAESMVMSLWRVDDDATRELMVGYYARLRAGGGRVDALRDAQLEMLRSGKRPHPYYWASFIASGEATSLDGKPVSVRDIVRGAASPRAPPSSRGCACGAAPSGRGATPWLLVALGLLPIRRMARRRAADSRRPTAE